MAADVAGAIFAVLQGDAALAALATGGGYHIDKIGSGGPDKSPINPEDTPTAYSLTNGIAFLKPCYTVRTQGRNSQGLAQFAVTVEVRVYERQGYQNTRAMLDRIYRLLDAGRGTVVSSGGKGYVVTHSTDLTGMMDDSVISGGGKRGASLEAATYTAVGGTP
jgi:hypothetical protein